MCNLLIGRGIFDVLTWPLEVLLPLEMKQYTIAQFWNAKLGFGVAVILQGDSFKMVCTETHILKDVHKWELCNNEISCLL